MNPNLEKVIEGLKCCFENAKCDGCPYEIECRKISFKTPENHCPILDDILSLLKEQEEVKPIKMQRMDSNFSFFVPYCLCGNCRYELMGKDVMFCSHCGRPVKLSDI